MHEVFYFSLEDAPLKLPELEREWSVLGPLREIHFHYRFGKQASAVKFATEATAKSCNASVVEADYQWEVTVSKRMEPSVANITYWKELLDPLAEAYHTRAHSSDDEDDYSHSDGWSYPPKEDILFSAPSNYKTERWQSARQLSESYQAARHEAVLQRAAVLFGTNLAQDSFAMRKRQIFDGTKFVDACTKATFNLVPSEFLRRARARSPENPEPTASAFAQWIYSLYGKVSGTDEDREAGQTIESAVWERRKHTFGSIDSAFLKKTGSDWSLVHNGLRIDQAGNADFFTIKSLRVNEVPLRASPDLLYVNSKTSEILIVEIKYSRLLITNNLWPNIWGQLWCYSQIDLVREAQKVTVVGEVWGDLKSRGNDQSTLCLRASVRRDPRTPAYDRFFRQLFQIYCRQNKYV